MENIQILNDHDLGNVDGCGWKANVVIGVAFAISPVLGIGVAVGYYINK